MSHDDAKTDFLRDDAAANLPQMWVRQPVMAGRFYPADPVACRAMVQGFLSAVPVVQRAAKAFGAIVPHAGWICSGAVAGRAIAALAAAADEPPDVVVVFAAIHSPWEARRAVLCSATAWRTPLGDVGVRDDLQRDLLSAAEHFEIDDRFHAREHAVEVELPLVQVAWPRASVLPVEVPPDRQAPRVGELTAAAVNRLGLRAVYLASSDLTHYGPMYDFTPAGVGLEALEWAKRNDAALLERVAAMVADEIVPKAIADRSACGPGAIAAMLTACSAQGATGGQVLQHTNSFEALMHVHPQPPTDAVGYAAVRIE